MTDKHLHIVCLDVPYPADYGGVFDLYYKIKALHKAGVKIHLHCFEYGRGEQPHLNQYCLSVNYYKRKNFIASFSFSLPVIVSSRSNEQLFNNLATDNYPILLEGIHCTYLLNSNKLQNRKVLVRLHNVEFEYYRELANTTSNIFKKIYYKWESTILKKFENKIANRCMFIAVSEKDRNTYIQKFSAKSINYLPVFTPFQNVVSLQGTGSYCLYHGNLSVSENEQAAKWLIKEVFNSENISLIIAGKNPSGYLKKLAAANKNVSVIANPSHDAMSDLIANAQLHVIPSFNKTGIKIKLLNALFCGRFVLTNSAGVDDKNLQLLCKIANTEIEFKEKIISFFQQPFDITDTSTRKYVLEKIYNNEINADQLIKWIW